MNVFGRLPLERIFEYLLFQESIIITVLNTKILLRKEKEKIIVYFKK